MISIRFDKETETRIREEAEKYGITVSEYVRVALEDKLAREGRATSAYEAGANLFGRHGSGDADRSTTVEQRLKDKLRARHRS